MSGLAPAADESRSSAAHLRAKATERDLESRPRPPAVPAAGKILVHDWVSWWPEDDDRRGELAVQPPEWFAERFRQ